jgi:hypothetical protein
MAECTNGPGQRRAARTQLVDDAERRHHVATGAAVFFTEGKPQHTEFRELGEFRDREVMIPLPLPRLLARRLGGDEALERIAQQRDVFGWVGVVGGHDGSLRPPMSD